MSLSIKSLRRKGRHERVRSKLIGTRERPRCNVFRSHKHLVVQLVDDLEGKTLLSCSTMEPEMKERIRYGGNITASRELGKLLAKQALEKGIRHVVFDRGGYLYHGRVKALAEAAREGGLEF